MKILIGSNGNNLESTISKRFGHAEYFIVYDTQNDSYITYENDDEQHNHDNLNYFLHEIGVKNFIVGNIGPHAFEKINNPDTRIFVARNMTIIEAVNKFKSNELKQITEPTMKHSVNDHDHHHHDHDHDDHHHHKQLNNN